MQIGGVCVWVWVCLMVRHYVEIKSTKPGDRNDERHHVT